MAWNTPTTPDAVSRTEMNLPNMYSDLKTPIAVPCIIIESTRRHVQNAPNTPSAPASGKDASPSFVLAPAADTYAAAPTDPGPGPDPGPAPPAYPAYAAASAAAPAAVSRATTARCPRWAAMRTGVAPSDVRARSMSAPAAISRSTT